MVMIVLRPAVVVQQRQAVEVFFNRGHWRHHIRAKALPAIRLKLIRQPVTRNRFEKNLTPVGTLLTMRAIARNNFIGAGS
jgi:hypothetical protein